MPRRLHEVRMVWETHSPGQELTQSAIIITSSDIGEYLVTVGRLSPEADVVSYAGAAGPSLNSALILSN